uniref:AAA domain-containing protein n=1 Tax=Rhabditophanes sp. KR3021 TaxID=114890 RepID=A0AC35UB78_9BILA
MGSNFAKPPPVKAGVVKPQLASNKVACKLVMADRSDHILRKVPQVMPKSWCYLRLKRTQRIYDYLLVEKQFVQMSNKAEHPDEGALDDKKTIAKLRGHLLGVGTVWELFDDEQHAIVSMSHSRRQYYIPILSIVDRSLLRLNATVLVKVGGSSANVPIAVVGVLPNSFDSSGNAYKVQTAPTESFGEVGGLDAQIMELKESVEYPLTHPELYVQMGISSPKGVILYGEPGTGKTLLAKAIANSTKATFLRVCGSDLVRKTAGEGPKQIRKLFEVAKQNAPCILFLDEIDAIGRKRCESSSKGEREIQRTMLALLNELDGFDDRGEVKIIMATNRIDALDSALIRPGRIDRKIELPKPDQKSKIKIFKVHSASMHLANDIKFDQLISKEREMSGAEIKAICMEAGMLALRQLRKSVKMEDMEQALTTVFSETKNEKSGMFS